MRKFIVLMIIGLFLLSFAGCTPGYQGVTQNDIDEILEAVSRAEDLFNASMSTAENNDRVSLEVPEGIGDATLVVFYSDVGNSEDEWFQSVRNCEIENLAESVAATLGADIYKISIAEKYPPFSDFDEWISRVYAEWDGDKRVELSSGKVENMLSYEHLVIISPFWGYTPVATPVLAFLDDYNLNGKTIIHIAYWGIPVDEYDVWRFEQRYPNTVIYFTYFNDGDMGNDYADAYKALLAFLEPIL